MNEQNNSLTKPVVTALAIQLLENPNLNEKQQNTVINSKNISKFGLGATLSTALLSNAHALDVKAALTDNTAESNIETAALFVLGIVVVIFSARKVIGFFSR